MSDDRAWKGLGEFIRAQRRIADLSLRQAAALARVSNPYLSQIERGIYKPSAQVLKGIADALQIQAETLYAKAGFLDADEEPGELEVSVEQAVRRDPKLNADQKKALIQVYKGFLGSEATGSRRST